MTLMVQLIALAALLAVPIALTLWMRRAALAATAADPARAWFGYWRFLYLMLNGVWIAWLVVVIVIIK